MVEEAGYYEHQAYTSTILKIESLFIEISFGHEVCYLYGILDGKPWVPSQGGEELEVEHVELEGDTLRHVYLLYYGVHQDAYRDGGDTLERELEVAHYVRSY